MDKVRKPNISTRGFMFCIPPQILFIKMLNSRRVRLCDEKEMRTKLWQKCLKGVILKNLRVDGRIILKFIIKQLNEMIWTGFFSFRIETSDGFL
jgi:hypothetical protein